MLCHRRVLDNDSMLHVGASSQGVGRSYVLCPVRPPVLHSLEISLSRADGWEGFVASVYASGVQTFRANLMEEQ